MFSQAKYIIAHNIKFDVNVLKSELHRGGSEIELQLLSHIEKNMKQICTMEKAKLIVQSKNIKGRLKPPSLYEMYKFATGKEISGHHDALDDVLSMREATQCLVEHFGLNLYRNQYASLKKKFDAYECKNELNELRKEILELKTSFWEQTSRILEAINNLGVNGPQKPKISMDVLNYLVRRGTIQNSDISPTTDLTELPSQIAYDGKRYYIDVTGKYGNKNDVYSEYGENIGCVDALDLLK